jgi:dolichol-phosphate mannosyltransferase
MTNSSRAVECFSEISPYWISPRHQKSRKLWVVLPAYNEAENLGTLIETLSDTLSLRSLTYEIVIVDDGSSDATRSVAQSFQTHIPLTVLVHEKNQGLGATIRDGFEYVAKKARANDILVAMDADNTHNPGLILSMVDRIGEGNDVVIASRYQIGSFVRGVSGFRQLLSGGASVLFRLFFPVRGVKDYTCGYRAYQVALIQKAFKVYGENFINQNGFECMVDILIKLRKLEAIFREVPMVLRYDLKKGNSKMRVAQTVIKSLSLLTKHRLSSNWVG